MENTSRDHGNLHGEERSESDAHDASFPIAEFISKEALINVLLKKGICTAEELYDEQRRLKEQLLRERQQEHQGLALVQIPPLKDTGLHITTNHRNRHWLRRKMAKRRWTRRLGTALFGWEWKKVRVKPKKVTET